MNSVEARLAALERRYPVRAYDASQYTRAFRPSAPLIKAAIEAAITVGLHPLISDTAVNELVREIGEQYEQ